MPQATNYRQAELEELSPVWTEYEPGKVRFVRVALGPPEEAGLPVRIPSLPGVNSQGKTADEALENVSEALQAVIEEYRESGEPIPWQDDPGLEPSETEKWIQVNVE